MINQNQTQNHRQETKSQHPDTSQQIKKELDKDYEDDETKLNKLEEDLNKSVESLGDIK